ncbi:hypothetical protein HELRODRAFT_181958 [Helobdella robusta]|uniref:Peptidase M13 N-terminal domain-containing protein n=1 Tax=Helobdella robusta TaxID=6412 RepID=T1FHI6_HELRO|nr:hypothetical protein HELRODRAFT_181958 [Helobdella robusta]ESN91902.1 hypothetical protein HELRODRAFT_181958 [Helobdella robusta]
MDKYLSQPSTYTSCSIIKRIEANWSSIDCGKLCASDFGLRTAEINSNIDTNVNPCDDFYKFACGSWIERTSIPDDDFQMNTVKNMADISKTQLIGLLNKSSADDLPSITNVKVFYKSCLNQRLVSLRPHTVRGGTSTFRRRDI